jgi:hypothetical protein
MADYADANPPYHANSKVHLQNEMLVKACGSVGPSPMTSATTPVSTATEQEYDQNDNQDQFHVASPLTVTALLAGYR